MRDPGAAIVPDDREPLVAELSEHVDDVPGHRAERRLRVIWRRRRHRARAVAAQVGHDDRPRLRECAARCRATSRASAGTRAAGPPVGLAGHDVVDLGSRDARPSPLEALEHAWIVAARRLPRHLDRRRTGAAVRRTSGSGARATHLHGPADPDLPQALAGAPPDHRWHLGADRARRNPRTDRRAGRVHVVRARAVVGGRHGRDGRVRRRRPSVGARTVRRDHRDAVRDGLGADGDDPRGDGPLELVGRRGGGATASCARRSTSSTRASTASSAPATADGPGPPAPIGHHPARWASCPTTTSSSATSWRVRTRVPPVPTPRGPSAPCAPPA